MWPSRRRPFYILVTVASHQRTKMSQLALHPRSSAGVVLVVCGIAMLAKYWTAHGGSVLRRHSHVTERWCTSFIERDLQPRDRHAGGPVPAANGKIVPRKIGTRPRRASLGRFVCAESAQDQALWLSVLNRRCSPQKFVFPKIYEYR